MDWVALFRFGSGFTVPGSGFPARLCLFACLFVCLFVCVCVCFNYIVSRSNLLFQAHYCKLQGTVTTTVNCRVQLHAIVSRVSQIPKRLLVPMKRGCSAIFV